MTRKYQTEEERNIAYKEQQNNYVAKLGYVKNVNLHYD